MKKLFVLLAATFVLASAINAQPSYEFVKNNIASLNSLESGIKKEKLEVRKELKKLEGNDASDLSKEQFYSDFGSFPETQWKRTANYDEASFIKEGQVLNAFYDADSKLVGTASDITFADLPSKAQKFINEKYKDYSVEDVLLYHDNELDDDMALYNVPLDDENRYFVELKKEDKEIVFQVHIDGAISFYTQLKQNNKS
jgi:hypothetical protein